MHLIESLLTKEECEFLSKQFYIEKSIQKNYDLDNYKTSNSYGFRPSNYFNSYMDKLKPIVRKYVQNNLNNVNTYVREYKNGCFLGKHVDREDIGITLSICLHNSTKKDWPLMALVDGKEFGYSANPGDGILLTDSHNTLHWRDTLECDESASFIALFVHWKEMDKNDKQKTTLI